MSMNWDSLLEPIFLFILALIAGTLWVIIPTQPRHPGAPMTVEAATAPEAPALRAKADDGKAALQVELATGTKAVTEINASVEKSREQVQLTDQELNQLRAQNQQLAASIQNEERVLANLQTELASLTQTMPDGQAQPGKLSQANKQMQADAEALRKLLAQSENESTRLQSQLATTQSRSDIEVPYVPKAIPANKIPVLVELIHNRVVPVMKGDYKLKAKLLGPVTATRVSEGETVKEIHDPDSSFAEFISKIKPEKQYISCLLNSDSFEAFREVRRIAREKHIDIGWEPAETSAGKLTLYPVHITKKVDSKPKKDVPRVAPILH